MDGSSCLLSAPHIAVPGHSTPWWCSNMELGYKYLWESREGHVLWQNMVVARMAAFLSFCKSGICNVHFFFTHFSLMNFTSYDLMRNPIASTNLKVIMLGCLSLRRCLMSVSLMFRTFFTATSCPCSFPKKTAPWAPLPTHCRSDISSNGTSHASEVGMEKT